MALSDLTSLFVDEDTDAEDQRAEFVSEDQAHSDELLRQLLDGDLDDPGEEHLVDRGDNESSHQPNQATLADADPDFEDDFDITLLMDLEAELAEQDASVLSDQGAMKVSAADFSPGEDLFVIEYDPSTGDPKIEMFGDPAGNSLVYCNGVCVLVMAGGDGILDLDDLELSPLS